MFLDQLLQHGRSVDFLPKERSAGSLLALTVDKKGALQVVPVTEITVEKAPVQLLSRYFLSQQYLHSPEGISAERKPKLLGILDKAVTAFLKTTGLELPEFDLNSDRPITLTTRKGGVVHSSVLFDFLLRYAEQSEESELRRKFFIPNSRVFEKPVSKYNLSKRWIIALYLGAFVLEDPKIVSIMNEWRDFEVLCQKSSNAIEGYDLSPDTVKVGVNLYKRLSYLASEVGSLEDLRRYAPEVSLDEVLSQVRTFLTHEKIIKVEDLRLGEPKYIADLIPEDKVALANLKFSRDLIYGPLPAWVGARFSLNRTEKGFAQINFTNIYSGNERQPYDIVVDLRDYIRQDSKGGLCRRDLGRLIVQKFLELLANPLRQGSRTFVSPKFKDALESLGRISHVDWAERELPSFFHSSQIMMTPTYKQITGGARYRVQYDWLAQTLKVPTANYIDTPGSADFLLSKENMPEAVVVRDLFVYRYGQNDLRSLDVGLASWSLRDSDLQHQAYLIYGGSNNAYR